MNRGPSLEPTVFARLSSSSFGAVSRLLVLVALTACEAAAKPNGEPLRGGQCAAVCEAQHFNGLDLYKLLVPACACAGCSSDCWYDVCPGEGEPEPLLSDECMPCVQAALDDDCHHGHFTGCWEHEACAALAQCVIDCPLNDDE